MLLNRRGVSTAVIAGVLVVAIAVTGVGYLLFASGGKSGTSSIPTTITTIDSSTPGSSTSTSSFRVVMGLRPITPLASSNVVANYTLDVTVIGSTSSPLTTDVSAPGGVTVQASPSQILPGSQSNQVALSFKVPTSVAPGTYPLNITITSSGQTFSQKFSFTVVKYLVVMVGNTYLPDKLTVPAGSTVYWMRLNGAIDQYDNGDHNVKFNNLADASPTLAQYQSWSFAFSQPGSYSYYCTFHPFMTGGITVA